jgi:hypothetical protein
VSEEIVSAWVESVKTWILDTSGFLKSCSLHASAAFVDDTAPWVNVSARIPYPAHEMYRSLNHRLSNLRSIMESPNVYFH